MLLTGTHTRTLDQKKRLALPKRVREQLDEPKTLFVTPGPDQCLWVYAEAGLEQLAQKLDQTPATDAEGRVFRRLYFAQIESVDVDRTGRILIPEHQKEFAGLKKQVIFTGVSDRVEVWNAERWGRYKRRIDANAEKLAKKLGEIGAL